MKIRKGDEVIVISGKHKGKRGVVLIADPKNEKVIVDNVNMIKRHRKPNNTHPDGSIEEGPAPIHVSNVALIDPKTDTATKIKYVIEDGKKVRVSKKSGQRIGG